MLTGLGRILCSKHATRTWSALHGTCSRISTTTLRNARSLPQTKVPSLSTFARTLSGTSLNPAAVSTTSLRELFDNPTTSNSQSKHATSKSPEGLFLYPNLRTPQTFLDSVNAAIARGHLLVERIANAPEKGEHEMRKVIKLFDRLSDVLCKVIDAAEVVRCLHPDPAWRQGAETVYEELFSWMNTLNTDPRLYGVLHTVLNTPSIEKGLSEAERQVALVFLRDFEKSGIHLSDAKRAQFVQLSDRIVSLGRDFMHNVSTPGPGPAHIIVSPPSRLHGLAPSYIQRITKTNKHGEKVAMVPTSGWESQMVLRHVEDEDVRRAMYVASMAEDKSKVAILDGMLRTRYDLAQLVGLPSYGHMFLGDKMVKNPENVSAFLQTLSKSHQAEVEAELMMLQKAKRVHTKNKDAKLEAWDRDFYVRMVSSRTNTMPHGDPISAYFSVGTTMDGLSKLFSHLYGIKFVPGSVQPGEVWHDEVQRLDVVDEREGLIGTIYCDFYGRQAKQQNAAHYTVRCSRRVDDDDEEHDIAEGMALREGIELAMAGPGVSMIGKEGRYQLPLAVLSCGFSRPSGGKPALLSWVEVETLFHEMGHAMHSMIGRADYHNVSGTRCPIDFVEIPSILMEHFLADPAVLGLFATHHQTGAPLPAGLLMAHQANRSTFQAMELHSQMSMAMLDQVYYSAILGDPSFNSTKSLEELQASIGIVPPVPGTAWQTGFGHLYGYGAGYYSYLFGRTVTGQIWNKVFRTSPTSRSAGERLREHVLKWGGGKDPWECLGGLLEDERLMKGDEESMRIVGDWGTKKSKL
ncbi:Mitochondrial intermediate peptidase [Entomortierella chlamydospora]|uniref:mitochondrial intermediate peptidase n=1 Tax=Entomortierella chlamydospora TaxID=101097 RepID=A0A9P6N744_9FUNG|nr:Mitochondrial intermediate peptidase [Entomortierella chlamydospora]KAG0024617.1 Mitochondrial intermediate peptidase [Entomortierella chlamydospora]